MILLPETSDTVEDQSSPLIPCDL